VPILIPGLLSSTPGVDMPSFVDGGDLEMTLELAFGADLNASPASWDFVDFSDRITTVSPIQISRGVTVGAGTRKTASCTGLTLLNDDGALTPELVTSPYWPYVDLGVPARLSIRTDASVWLSDTFTRTVASGWGTADVGGAWAGITGTSVSAGAGKLAFSATNQIRLMRAGIPHRDVDLTFDSSVAAVTTGAPITVGPALRSSMTMSDFVWPMVEFDPAGTIRIGLWRRTGGTYSQITSIVQPGLTYTGGTAIRCRILHVGNRLRAKAWLAAGTEPDNWLFDLVVDTHTTGTDYLGVASWCLPGNTNVTPVVSVDNVTAQQPRYPRIEGFIADIRATFRPIGDGTTHSLVQLDIGGVSTRLERRTADAISPLRRSMEKAPIPPIAYWPLEDKAQSTSAASAFPDQPPMVPTGPVGFAFDLGVPDDTIISQFGSSALVSLAAGARLSGPVPLSATGEWTVSAELQTLAPLAGGGITEIRTMEWSTPSGTHQRWALVNTATGFQVRAYNDTTATVTNVVTYGTLFSSLVNYSVTAEQNGANIDVVLYGNASSLAVGSVAGTLGAVGRLNLNPDQKNTTASVDPFGIRFLAGHATVHDQVATALPFYYDGLLAVRADRGWAYERLHMRAARLADEENVPLRWVGDVEQVTSLNAQPEGAFIDLMTATVDSGSGSLLWEAEFGYLYRDRTDRYNQDPALVVDLGAFAHSGSVDPADVLVPKLNVGSPNFWTVERRNGSASTAAAAKEFRDRRGTVADKATLDVLYDADTGPHAQWRVHTSVDGKGAHYPAFTVELHANPDLIDDWLLCDIGSRAQWPNAPTIAGLSTIDQIVDGITERFSARQSGDGITWTAGLDTSPASVWDVGVWDGDSVWEPSNTVLSSGVISSATSWSMNSNGEPWTTGAVSLRAQLGKEEVLITNISGSGSAWTFTVTRAVNGVSTAHTAGADKVTLLDAGAWAL